MPLEIQLDPVPLETGEAGVVLVRGSRVTLDTVVEAFRDGASAEEIVEQYPSLQLGDVYAIVGYYLRHSAEVDAYLAQRRKSIESLREEHRRRWDDSGLRAKLLARRNRPA
jgi:uncharacterized protein (DUF433 family)